jgi:hypothetical protein
VTLFPAYEVYGSSAPFCCDQPYNFTTQSCTVSSKGDSQAFSLPIGRVVYNRTDGSSMMNGTLSASSLHLDTCNAQAISLDNQTNQTSNALTSPQADVGATCSDPENLTAITAGIAVPLGVLLLASLVALAIQIRHNRSLKRTLQRGLPSENLPMSQATSLEGRPQGKGLAQGRQGAHSYSALNELSNDHTPIESGGRPVVVELPTRFS